VNDAVYYSGSSYIATATNTNKQPDTNASSWSLLAQQGATGAAGSGSGGLVFTSSIYNLTTSPSGYGAVSGILGGLTSAEANAQQLVGSTCTAGSLYARTDQTVSLSVAFRLNGVTVYTLTISGTSASASSLGVSLAPTDLIDYSVSGTAVASSRLKLALTCQ
jgi:hypothetical protein